MILKSGSAHHGAREKLLALKLLNKAILQKNQEFNRHVEASLMQHLYRFAKFGGEAMKEDSSSATVESKSSKYSSQTSEADFISKGENLFGPDEKDA